MYFQSDIGRFKQIQLYLSTYISSIPYDSTIITFHLSPAERRVGRLFSDSVKNEVCQENEFGGKNRSEF